MKTENRQAAIGALAIQARVDAIAPSYASLRDWAFHQPLGCSEAMSWPDEIEVFSSLSLRADAARRPGTDA